MPKFENLAFQNDSHYGLVDTSWIPIRIGVYVRHLERWLHYFPLRQFHFVSGERLIVDPSTEITRVQVLLIKHVNLVYLLAQCNYKLSVSGLLGFEKSYN